MRTESCDGALGKRLAASARTKNDPPPQIARAKNSSVEKSPIHQPLREDQSSPSTIRLSKHATDDVDWKDRYCRLLKKGRLSAAAFILYGSAASCTLRATQVLGDSTVKEQLQLLDPDAAMIETAKDRPPERTQQVHEYVKIDQASTWLSVLPTDREDRHLSPPVFHDSHALRYG
ncbi:hypothetical protein GJ496_007349 [Pomphorhynchus laevis]|nr:hypothetical protein GJ496_007349 [Pomphorhynchus laevis]